MSQLPSDCLNDIFEYLEDDKVSLRSCLLVNRLRCEVSVRILWRSIRNYNTLIACLSNDSKEILSKNGIVTSTSVSRPPMFNYVSFCNVLSTYEVIEVIGKITQLFNHNQQYISPRNLLKNNLSKVTREIFKFLIAQTSLREVDLTSFSFENNNQEFTSIPGVMGCLGNLSELSCNSNICSCFFYQLSQTCHNIQSLNIKFVNIISNG